MTTTSAAATSMHRKARGLASGDIAERLLFACAAATALTTLGILVVLADGTVRFFAHVSITRFFTDLEWTPLFAVPRYGIWPLLAGTLLTSTIAVAVAVSCGVLSAIYLAEFASKNVRRALKPMLELLAGVPTLVYGAFALIVVTPLLQRLIPGLAGFNAMSPGLVMGLMLSATVTTLVDDALRAVPRALREGAWALGARRMDTIVRVVLPAARSGIVAAATLVAARAVGETMIVAIAAGQQPRLTFDPRVPIETMTAFIMQVSMGDVAVDSDAFRSLFVVAAALFLFTFALNGIAHRVARRPARHRSAR